MEEHMEKLADEDVRRETREIRKVAFASFIGTAIEFYDFYIYGTAAALVFGTVFFPELSSVSGTLAALATFGVAFFARPLGGVIFGHYGDKVGRKTMLIFSLLLMGLSTFLVGLLPGYATIGVAAAVLLVILRFLQGIGLGGEWGGAVLMAAEHAPPSKRGFYTSFPQVGPSIGFLLSNGSFLLLTATLSKEQFASWGWRMPFLLSIVLVGIGLFIRARVAETPVFKRVMETRTEARVPVMDMVRTYPLVLALASGAAILVFGFFYILTVFSVSYGTTNLGLPNTTMLYCTIISIVFMSIGVPIFAVLSDSVGRRNIYLVGSALAGLWAFPMFWLFDTKNPAFIALALSVGMVFFAMMYGPMAAFFSELFGTRVRYSGASVSYSLGGILGAALAPTIATQLLSATGTSLSISLYIAIMALITFVCTFLLSETYLTDLSSIRSEERRLITEGSTTGKHKTSR